MSDEHGVRDNTYNGLRGVRRCAVTGGKGILATMILVHDAWTGGWAWQRVQSLLVAAGHEVFRPTLTGLGDRAHLADPDINLDLHIEDVVALLEYERLREVVLVGHGYGGMVVTGVADRIPEWLTHLIYLDAQVPDDGQSMFDLLGKQQRDWLVRAAWAEGDGWLIPLPASYGGLAGGDIHWIRSNAAGQPIETFDQKLELRHPPSTKLTRSYIRCTLATPADQPLPAYVKRIRSDPTWQYHELATGHAPQITAPNDLVDVLLDMVSDPVDSGTGDVAPSPEA